MQRVVSVYLPSWPIDRLRLSVEPSPRPLILTDMQHNRRVVSAAASRAQQLGIRVGMPVSQAQAMCPEIAMRPADIDGDRAALDRLAAWCLRYAPIAAADPPDGLLIDISGAAHLRGGEAALVAELDGRLRRAGIGARIALAGTRGAAWGSHDSVPTARSWPSSSWRLPWRACPSQRFVSATKPCLSCIAWAWSASAT